MPCRQPPTDCYIPTPVGEEDKKEGHFYGAAMPLAAGSLVDGKYEIKGVLGAGAYGVVYEATHAGLARRVALKVLSDAVDFEMSARLMREAQALSAMKHRNIIQCFGHGTYNGAPFIAVEYVAGGSLQKELANGVPLDYRRTLDLMVQVCDGLSTAHANGIVHRDLKPANVLLADGPGGKQIAKIIDFGLAKVLPEATINAKQQQLTDMGLAIGTVYYMSPEQCLGHPADARSDIYGLGCILYECLTGQRLFEGNAAVAVMFKHFNEQPARLTPMESNRASERVQAILDRMLAKEPGDRYQSIGEVRDDLLELGKLPEKYVHQRSVVNGGGAAAAPPVVAQKNGHRSRTAWILASVAAISTGAFLFLSTLFHPQTPHDIALRCINTGDSALIKRDFNLAVSSFRAAMAAADEERLRMIAMVRLSEAYALAGYPGEFFKAVKPVRDTNKILGCKLAHDDMTRYHASGRGDLEFSARAVELSCSPISGFIDGKDYIGEAADLIVRAISDDNVPQGRKAIADEIGLGAINYARQHIREFPVLYADICATRAQLSLACFDFRDADETSKRIESGLKLVKLDSEDQRVYDFCRAFVEQKKIRDPNALDTKRVIEWLPTIYWYTTYVRNIGDFQAVGDMLAVLTPWCKKNYPPYAVTLETLKDSPWTLGHREQWNNLRIDGLSDMPAEPMQRAHFISLLFQKSNDLVDQRQNAEALQFFDTAVADCSKIHNCDLASTFVGVPRKAVDNAPGLMDAAQRSMDAYYNLCRLNHDAPLHFAEAAATRCDVAFLGYRKNFNEATVKIADLCSADDLSAARVSKNSDAIANATFRAARLWALRGKLQPTWDLWTKCYAWYSVHKKDRVMPLLKELSAYASDHDRNTAYLLTDEANLIVDGVSRYPTIHDLDALHDPKMNDAMALGDRVGSQCDRFLRLSKFDQYKTLVAAAFKTAERIGNTDMVVRVLDTATIPTWMARPDLTHYVLDTAREYAEHNKVSTLYAFSMALQEAEFANMTFALTAKDRGTEKARKAEALYQKHLNAAEHLVDEREGLQMVLYDSKFRLARVYAQLGDAEHFQPLYDDAVHYYRKAGNKELLQARSAEMGANLRIHGGLTHLAEVVEKQGKE